MSSLQQAVPERVHSAKCDLAGEVLRTSGRLRLQVTGWSMLPSIIPGDTLVLESASQNVQPGAIVLFRRDGRLFVHRVREVSAGNAAQVFTQGDAMPQPDAPVPVSELLGTVRYIVRNGRLMTPEPKLDLPRRAVAGLVRRSNSVARLIVRIHRMRASLQESSQPCPS